MIRRLTQRFRAWFRRNALPLQLSALVLLLIFVYLIPSIFVLVRAGEAAVLWRRFGYFGLVTAGTVTDHYYDEGMHLKMPWDELVIYNVRLQNATGTYDALLKNGLEVKVEISVRFRPLETELGSLHKHAGPEYIKLLVLPEVGAHARKQIALLDPAELYTSRREEVENAIHRNLTEEFKVRFQPVTALYGTAAVLRQRILRVLASSPTPLTTEQIARQVNVQPADFLNEDVEAMVRGNLVHERVVGNERYYRINSEAVADSVGLENLFGQGKPLIYVEDVLIRGIDLPEQIEKAIQNKLVIEQQTQEYEYRLLREEKEKDRKRIEAEGIRLFQDIVREGISDRYLKWKGIDATLELAKSNNTKVVVIGSAGDGLPIILGPLESAPSPPVSQTTVPALSNNTPVGRRGTAAGSAGTPLGSPPEPPSVPFLQTPPGATTPPASSRPPTTSTPPAPAAAPAATPAPRPTTPPG
jgi:regulator of protease activity HflC (stomatin/prohibitin superfamily)